MLRCVPQPSRDERRFDSNDAISGAFERCVSPPVGPSTFAVIHAIDFDHETLRGSVEIRDEATQQRHLAAKHYAELAATNAIAASGVEGPARAQRQRHEHDRPFYGAHRKELRYVL